MIEFEQVHICPNPASLTLEGYSPVNGRAHGSLDRVAYACASCAESIVEEHMESLTVYTMGTASSAACGRLVTYDAEQRSPMQVYGEGYDELAPGVWYRSTT